MIKYKIGTYEQDSDIALLTYFDFCYHSWLTVNMISALKSLGLSLKYRFWAFYIKSKTREVSVRAAAAEIIAADFYAAPTDSLLPKKFGSSCRQQGSAPIVWLAVFQDGGVHMQNMTCFNFITVAKIKWINAKC